MVKAPSIVCGAFNCYSKHDYQNTQLDGKDNNMSF